MLPRLTQGYSPPMSLLKRVLQIVFEVASCPQKDALSRDESFQARSVHQSLPSSLSLLTPAEQLFPECSPNSCEVVIVRSMLLRAQYGGMKCDVQMLQSFAVTWLERFRAGNVLPTSITWSAPKSATQPISWLDVPRILHEKARERSEELVTSNIVCPGGLVRLTLNDVCVAGIDFHCSPAVDYILSQRDLCGRLAPLLKNGNDKGPGDRDWMAGQVKNLIWQYSSGINYRRSLLGAAKRNEGDSIPKLVWRDVLKTAFDGYTKKFVRDRLA